MNGPEHYREAERLIDEAHTAQSDNGPGCGTEEILAEAQVHATLALAAAAAFGIDKAGMKRDWDEWDAAFRGAEEVTS